MRAIPGFQMHGMPEPLTIFENGKGYVQFHYRVPISQHQTHCMIKYLVDEGFLKVPEIPPDDYKLHPELP